MQASNLPTCSTFTCPVCIDYVLPPIFECGRGHVICPTCSLRRCPKCEVPEKNLRHIRNTALDKFAETMEFPCEFKGNGCRQRGLKLAEKGKHEQQCSFMPCNCPGVHCEWKGLLIQILAHLLEVHEVPYHETRKDIIIDANELTKTSGVSEWLMLQRCHGRDFLVVVQRLIEQQFAAYVMLIGNKADAADFNYRLKLCNSQNEKYFQSVTRSIAEGIDVRTAQHDYFFFSQNDVESCVDGGVLEINLLVQKYGK